MTTLTRKEKEEQILLSGRLGPIFPLYGIVEASDGALNCECGDANCKNPGKHPRWRAYKKKATTDPEQIIQWLRRYQNANYGIVTGPVTIAVDADVRPGENGLRTLDYLQIDEGERLPYTVEVVTGRGNGSRHFYFKTPSHAKVRTRAKVLPGLDVRAEGGYCVAPGSRHIEGGYYHFHDECRPDEQAVADLPDFVLSRLIQNPRQPVLPGPQVPHNVSSTMLDTTPTPVHPPLSDGVVMGVMLRDPVARFYWNGGRRNRTASEDDFALACKLAFYCRHDLKQMYRLFMGSNLYRPKFNERRPGGNYALWTLKNAINATPQVWIRKKRKRPSTATGAKKGRKVSPDTSAVLDLYNRAPDLTEQQIAIQLRLDTKQVRDAIRYHGRRAAENARTLIHSKRVALESQTNSGSESSDQAA